MSLCLCGAHLLHEGFHLFVLPKFTSSILIFRDCMGCVLGEEDRTCFYALCIPNISCGIITTKFPCTFTKHVRSCSRSSNICIPCALNFAWQESTSQNLLLWFSRFFSRLIFNGDLDNNRSLSWKGVDSKHVVKLDEVS